MDDQSLVPQAPVIDLPEAQEDQVLDTEDKKTAQAYTHPGWEKVEDMFNEELVSLSQPVDTKLEANEFKIESIANQKAAAAVKRIWGRVIDAVESTGTAKPTRGGK